MPNFMQETRKKYSAVLAAEPEPTHARTHGRTHGSEFIGSFRKLKLPGNQLRKRLEEMGQKEHFLPKTTKFWPKSRKREFSPKQNFRHILKDIRKN